MVRACQNCVHFTFEPGEAGYSEYTPGCDMELYCNKDHWAIRNMNSSLQEVRDAFNTAENCVDFSARPPDE